MPLLRITTNQKLGDEQKNRLLSKASAETARILGKPENYVMVILQDDTPVSFAGQQTPAAYLELKSLGLPDDKSPALSKSLCEFVETELAVAKDRIYIEFSSPPRHFWGWNSSTF